MTDPNNMDDHAFFDELASLVRDGDTYSAEKLMNYAAPHLNGEYATAIANAYAALLNNEEYEN